MLALEHKTLWTEIEVLAWFWQYNEVAEEYQYQYQLVIGYWNRQLCLHFKPHACYLMIFSYDRSR